jgi:hypothetical protein
MDFDLPPLADAYDSPEHELYSMYVRKIISAEDYFTQTAIMVAAKPHLHFPVYVPSFHPALSEYIDGRLAANPTLADSVLIFKLLRWLVVYTTALGENQTRISTLRWALGRIPEAMKPETQSVEDALEKHRAMKYLDADLISRINRVIEMDSYQAKSSEL